MAAAPASIWVALFPVQANTSQEVLARTSAANRALGCDSCPVPSAWNIERLTKNAALSSFVLSRFFHLTPTWPKLNGTQMRKMEGTYRNLVRTAQTLAKVSQPPLHIAMAAARLLYLPRRLKVAPTALLIRLDANRSSRDVLRHDCLSMWLQATFVNQVLPHPAGPDAPVLVWVCCLFHSPLEAHG